MNWNVLDRCLVNILEGVNSFLRPKRDSALNSTSSNNLLIGVSKNLYNPRYEEKVSMSPLDRLRHIYICGATGMGKTCLIYSMIKQDVMKGRGFALIDAHGDLTNKILNFMALPESTNEKLSIEDLSLQNRLILIEPFNPDWTTAFNPLESEDKGNPYLQVSEMLYIFKKVWKDVIWGPRMDELLRNTLITLAENELTLLEIRPLLTDQLFRNKVIEKVTNSEVRDYWLTRYNQLSEKMQAVYREPILNKVSIFVSDPLIRNMIGQRKSTVNFRKAMDEGKWILLNLSKGRLKENCYLLGGLFITKLQQATLSRSDIPEEKRRNFFLYVDEFQNFAGNNFLDILSESRKYGLGLVFAHQNFDQIDRELCSSIFGNIACQIFFRLSSQDAQKVTADVDSNLKKLCFNRLVDLKVGEAFVRIKGTLPRFVKTPYEEEDEAKPEDMEAIKLASFKKYAKEKAEVEIEMKQRNNLVSDINDEKKQKQISLKRSNIKKGEFAPDGAFEEADE